MRPLLAPQTQAAFAARPWGLSSRPPAPFPPTPRSEQPAQEQPGVPTRCSEAGELGAQTRVCGVRLRGPVTTEGGRSAVL